MLEEHHRQQIQERIIEPAKNWPVPQEVKSGVSRAAIWLMRGIGAVLFALLGAYLQKKLSLLP